MTEQHTPSLSSGGDVGALRKRLEEIAANEAITALVWNSDKTKWGLVRDVAREAAAALTASEADNDALQLEISQLARIRISLAAALKPFLVGDETMEKLLWGGMDDEALGTVSVKLKHFRAARKALHLDSTP